MQSAKKRPARRWGVRSCPLESPECMQESTCAALACPGLGCCRILPLLPSAGGFWPRTAPRSEGTGISFFNLAFDQCSCCPAVMRVSRVIRRTRTDYDMARMSACACLVLYCDLSRAFRGPSPRDPRRWTRKVAKPWSSWPVQPAPGGPLRAPERAGRCLSPAGRRCQGDDAGPARRSRAYQAFGWSLVSTTTLHRW